MKENLLPRYLNPPETSSGSHLRVIFNEIDTLFLQLNQNLTTDCHWIYMFCKSNSYRNNFTCKMRKSSNNQLPYFRSIEVILGRSYVTCSINLPPSFTKKKFRQICMAFLENKSLNDF